VTERRFIESVQRRGAFVFSPPSVYCSPIVRSPGKKRAQAGDKQSCRNSPVGHPSIFRGQSRDPLSARYRSSGRHRETPAERHNHFILLDKYGRFPFEALPRNYKAAVTKFGKAKLDANGLLPWQIGVYSEKLTEAMKAGKWEEAKLYAAILANYVAEAHDPFDTTDNFDGRLSAQPGVNERFGTTLIDRYSSFFPMRPNDAIFINDPTDRAFEACLSSHSWLETILLADRNARRGENSFNDEYYDRFYNQAAAILIRQLSDAATDVGSFWLTAWKNAGSPQLPH